VPPCDRSSLDYPAADEDRRPVTHFKPDVAHFVAGSPYLELSEPTRALRFLSRHVEAGEECVAALAGYPALSIEPLQFFYVCLRSLGALDVAFVESLLTEQSWRGLCGAHG
jgi:hypothetical protein